MYKFMNQLDNEYMNGVQGQGAGSFEDQLRASIGRRKQAEETAKPSVKAQNPIGKPQQVVRLASRRVWRSVAGVAVVVVLGMAIVQPWRQKSVVSAVEMEPIAKTVTQVPDTAIPMKSFRKLYEEYARYWAMLKAQQKDEEWSHKTAMEQAEDFGRFLSQN